MKRSATTKLFAIYSLYLIIALGGYVAGYIYIESKGRGVEAVVAETKQLNADNERFRALSNKVAGIEGDAKKLDELFIYEEQISDFFVILKEIADATGASARVESLNEAVQTEGATSELVVTLSIEGSLSEVYHYLVLFESLPLKMTIDTVRLLEKTVAVVNEDETKTEKVVWNGTITARALQIKKNESI